MKSRTYSTFNLSIPYLMKNRDIKYLEGLPEEDFVFFIIEKGFYCLFFLKSEPLLM